jgi:catechol 2,3-dioxygenase
MGKTPSIAYSHLGLHCFDLDAMVAFYTRMLGMAETDRGTLPTPDGGSVRIVFLSGEPRDHHQLALVDGRGVERGATLINQMSFRLDSLATLRALKAKLDEAAVPIQRLTNHCLSWSAYFHDPEGNRIEAFVDAPFYVHQPIIEPLDLSLSDEEIVRQTEAMFGADPSFKRLDDWKREFARELESA